MTTTYIALLRGINVGGRNVLRMQELRRLLEALGLKDIKTYIQSGNVVFQSETVDTSQLADQITAEIDRRHGFAPLVLVLEGEELDQVVESRPFPEAESQPKTLHVNFLTSLPKNPDLNALEGLQQANERFELKGKVFFLHAPDGIGRSKLAANAEKLLGVPMTGRNWRTVLKIMTMAQD